MAMLSQTRFSKAALVLQGNSWLTLTHRQIYFIQLLVTAQQFVFLYLHPTDK